MSVAAAAQLQENSLENALDKMQAEWGGRCFEELPWRATGCTILRGVDDIQQVGPAHIWGDCPTRPCRLLVWTAAVCGTVVERSAGLDAAPGCRRQTELCPLCAAVAWLLLQLLDDQIVKTQAMRASPYIGPFEERVKGWEAQLNKTQDILDEWLR